MKKFFVKNSIASFALLFALALFSCENSVTEDDVIGIGAYHFPDATTVTRRFVSQVYSTTGASVAQVQTVNLDGWEDVPFLSFEDACGTISLLNQRGYSFSKSGSIYKYKYNTAAFAPGTAPWPAEWNSDELCFDVSAQTVWSDEFNRIISPAIMINNGFGADCVFSSLASAACPKIDFSSQTTQIKKKERTTIRLGDYGLKMFVIDGVLYVPFQALAGVFIDCYTFSFSGTDYYFQIDQAGDTYATKRAYEFGRRPGATRSRLKAEYNYSVLCLVFDATYSLKNSRAQFGKSDIGRFNDSIFSGGLGFDLLSCDTAVYDAAFVRLLVGLIDDGHTSYHEPSLYQSYESIDEYKKYAAKQDGPRNTALNAVRAEMSARRSASGGKQGVFYVNEGGADKMAVIAFDRFMSSNPGSATDWETLGMTNAYIFLERAFADIANHPNVRNVVFDLSNNPGGVIKQCVPCLAFVRDSSEFCFPFRNQLDNSLTKFSYIVNDGVSQKKNYNFYVLTSPFTFSTANAFASICHYQLGIPIVGKRSGGGAAAVKMGQTADGALFQASSAREMCALDKNDKYVSIDAGVPVDLELDYEDFYGGSSLYQNLFNRLKAKYSANF